MRWRSSVATMAGSWLLLACTAFGDEAAKSAVPADVLTLTARIDELVVRRWSENRIEPAHPASDAEFLRRVWLDLAGKIPPASEARAFILDEAPHKRRDLVERLLNSPAYAVHFAHVWRKVLLSEAESSFEARFAVPGFEVWLQKQLAENVPYDRMVRAILTVPLGNAQESVYGNLQSSEPTPVGFFLAKEMKPENLAAATARIFMGVRIECAQCHHHPFARWKQEDFWSQAAFFAGAEPAKNNVFGALAEIFDRRELTIPGTEQIVQARLIDGAEPEWQFRVPARQTFATWLTARDNRYFAPATVNRIWGYFLGTALVEPVDDFDERNPPSNPELLAELAHEFVEHDFDLKFLIRAIVGSRPYQLASVPNTAARAEPDDFACMSVRAMSPEQLFASIQQATGFVDPNDARNPFAYGTETPRAQFVERFAEQGQTPTERQSSILQALAMMNGRLTAAVTDLQDSQTLVAVAECPLFDTAAKIDALYLSTLTRLPTDAERARLVAHVDSGKPGRGRQRALADVFWALLNSSEFALNH